MTRHIRILLVDDDAAAREGYREYFEMQGFVVETAADGGAALKTLEYSPIDIMVLDLELPVVDGWEVARRAKALYASIRIVALTGHTSQTEQASAARAGCDLYVAKPCAPRQLVEQIRKLFA